MSGQLANKDQRSIKSCLEHKLVQLCNDIQIIKHRLLKVEAAAATAPPAKDKLLQQMALLKAERKQRAVKQSLEALQQGRQAD